MRQRGYTLPLVILVLTTLAAAMTLMVVTLGSGARTTNSMLGRRHTLYACDGIVRGLMVKSRDYFAETPVPDAIGLRNALCDGAAAPGCSTDVGTWFPDFDIEEVTTSTGATDVVEEVPTGPFRGQMARRTDITLSVTARKKTTSQRCRVTQSAINSEIGLFQFAVFGAMSIELRDPPTMDIRGRVHINGDFDAGDGPLTIEKVTAAGKITAYGSGFHIRDAASAAPGTPVALTSSNDSNSANWRVTSENTWHGNAQDVAWGVPMLRLPVATTAPVQGGRDASATVRSNSGMLRVLVDPPRAGDDDATANERLANKAAIRIINGIWYKNDGTAFPGTPIWSDHPVAYTTHDAAEAAFVNTTKLASAPTSAAGPKRYSHYETAAGVIANDLAKPSVISYGSLKKVGAGWVVSREEGGVLDAVGSDPFKIADGTRSGFVDGRVQKNVTNGTPSPSPIDAAAGRMLPLNFNVAAFVEALEDTTTAGELGHHFPTGLGDNAIVWIANTWPGWLNGFPNGAAAKPPAITVNELAAVPQPLCGGSGTLAGTINKVACTATGMTGPTAVRVWNASEIKASVLPRGLTIVTNGPMYVLGDTNTKSLEEVSPGVFAPGTPRHESATGPWVPMMVGGDAVTLLSNKWDDDQRLWVNTTPIGNKYSGSVTDSSRTTWVMAMLGGHVERVGAPSSGGVNNFPRFLEGWTGVEAVIHGSLVAGYRSVYQDQGFSVGPGPYSAPNRTWKFDPNLAKPANQPPGTPSFFVSAVERWQRD